MRRLNGTFAALAIGGTLLFGGQAASMAQDTTPLAVDPAECVVAPRTAEEIAEIWNAGDYVTDAEITAGVLPTGNPAPDEVVAAVNATLRQLIACSNANDFARQLATMTDEGTYFYDPGGDVPVETLAAYFDQLLATPIPVDDYEVVLPLSDVIVLDDGRVGAVEVDDPTDGEGNGVYIIFTEEDGVWLIDLITEIAGPATPEATPAA